MLTTAASSSWRKSCCDDDQDDGHIDDNEFLPLRLEGEQHQPEASKDRISNMSKGNEYSRIIVDIHEYAHV
jgi:hypothetical protein